MTMSEMAWSQRQRARWMRPDAERWRKPAFLKTEDVHESDDAGNASIELKTLQLDAARMRVAVADIRFALTLDRVLREIKSWEDQPRVPAGDSDGGQWTADGEGGSDDEDEDGEQGEGDDGEYTHQIDGGTEDEDGFDLSDILSALGDELREMFSFLDFLNGDDRAQVQLVSDNNNSGNPDPFPQIPKQEPNNSKERNAILRNLSGWIGRNAGIAGGIYGLSDQIEWIGNYGHLIESYKDPPRTLEELQAPVGSDSQRGYHDHHIVEKSAEKYGIPRDQIYNKSNVARIPELKHHEITGYYNSKDAQLPDGTRGSPREFLRDKSFEERREFGLGVLRDKGVLK